MFIGFSEFGTKIYSGGTWGAFASPKNKQNLAPPKIFQTSVFLGLYVPLLINFVIFVLFQPKTANFRALRAIVFHFTQHKPI